MGGRRADQKTPMTHKTLSGLFIGANPYGGPTFTQVRTKRVYEDVGVEEIQVQTWFDIDGETQVVVFPVDLELDRDGGYDGYENLLQDLVDETVHETYRLLQGPGTGELDQQHQVDEEDEE